MHKKGSLSDSFDKKLINYKMIIRDTKFFFSRMLFYFFLELHFCRTARKQK